MGRPASGAKLAEAGPGCNGLSGPGPDRDGVAEIRKTGIAGVVTGSRRKISLPLGPGHRRLLEFASSPP